MTLTIEGPDVVTVTRALCRYEAELRATLEFNQRQNRPLGREMVLEHGACQALIARAKALLETPARKTAAAHAGT